MIQEEAAFTTERDLNWVDRSRTLIVTSRGITSTQARFVIDIFNLLPHSKKSAKLDRGSAKETRQQIQELCELYSCRTFIYFENKKRYNFYMWVGSFPEGPTMKFSLDNIVSSSDMKLQGNALKSSRHILSFDKTFSVDPVWKVAEELLTSAFNVPLYHPKSKSVIDHVLSFSVDPLSSTCYFKNYQIFQQAVNKDQTSSELYEIGPRFILTPILILSGFFGGDVLFRDKITTIIDKKHSKSNRGERHTRQNIGEEKIDDFSQQEFSDDD